MDGTILVGFVDMAYPEHKVAIELDGFRFHDRPDGFDRERARGNTLEAIGWRVLRITKTHLAGHGATVADWVRRARALAGLGAEA